MILVFGTVCIDRIHQVPFLPPKGGYVEATSEVSLLGGEAANTANALRSWQVEAFLHGNAFAPDLAGIQLREMLAKHGLPVSEMPDAPPTPVCDIYVTPDGDRTMFGIGFSDMERGIDLETMPLQAGEWFTAEPNMVKASAKAALKAHAAGMRLYLMDFSADGAIPPGSFWQGSTDWVGVRSDVEANLAWVREWIATLGCFTILTDGPGGFIAGGPDRPVRAYPVYPAPKVVDMTGAGDMFRAGMLYGLSSGWEVARCLRFASAAGALGCRAVGATTDVPTVQEIEAHIAAHSEISRDIY